MSNQKIVLILAYDFPPYISVGAQRPYSWYNYLNEHGFYPIIITRQWANNYGNNLDYIAPGDSKKAIIKKTETGSIIQSPYKPNLSNRLLLKYGKNRFRVLRKLITAYFEVMQWFFICGPKKEVYKHAKSYLKQNKVDIIIASGEPFILFRYASLLSKKFKTKWIADYRDPWSQNKSRSSNSFLKKLNHYNEKKYVSTSSHITTVTEFFSYQIQNIIKSKKISIVPNGYDINSLKSLESVKQKSDSLNIGFVGTIYPWNPIEPFLRVISKLIDKGLSIKLNLYGINNTDEVKEIATSNFPKLLNHICFFEKIEYKIMMEKLAENNVLLLFNYYSFIGTKIYDYLAAQRLILLCFENDAIANKLKADHFILPDHNWNNKNLQANLLTETQSGIFINDISMLETVIEDLNNDLKQKGYVECIPKNIDKYSRQEQTKKLVNVINNVIGS